MKSKLALLLALVAVMALAASGDTFRFKPGCEYDGEGVIEGTKLGKSGTKIIIKTDQGKVISVEESSLVTDGDTAPSGAGGTDDATDDNDDSELPAITFEPLLASLESDIAAAKSQEPAFPELIRLRDGRAFAAKTSREDKKVTLKMEKGSIVVDESEIVGTEPAPDVVFRQRLQSTHSETPREWVELGKWCLGQTQLTEGRKRTVMCLQKALALTPNDDEVHRLLGYDLVKGEWIRGDELARSKGLVQMGKRWVEAKEQDLANTMEQAGAWGDLETMSYHDAVRRTEQIIDGAQVQLKATKSPFKPWRDECSARTSSEEKSWSQSKRDSRMGTLTHYARCYARIAIADRRALVAAIVEYEARDAADLSVCPECNGQVKYEEQKQCETCHGAGTIVRKCEACHGDGQRNCPKCHGSGRVDCKNCANGVVSQGGKLVDCPMCDGGHVACPECNGRKTMMCTQCSGTGSLPPASCADCDGRGTITVKHVCKTCGGTGRAHMTKGFHK